MQKISCKTFVLRKEAAKLLFSGAFKIFLPGKCLYMLIMLLVLPSFTLYLPYSASLTLLTCHTKISWHFVPRCLFAFISCINFCLKLTANFTGFFTHYCFLPPLFLHSFFFFFCWNIFLNNSLAKFYGWSDLQMYIFTLSSHLNVNVAECKSLNLNFSLRTLKLLSHHLLVSRSVRNLIFIWFSSFCK